MVSSIVNGQPNRPEKIVEYTGTMHDIVFCLDCGLEKLHEQIRLRIKEYAFDTTIYYLVQKRDTLIEVIRFYNGAIAYYDYYSNFKHLIRYNEDLDSGTFHLTIMYDDISEKKDWSVKPNEINITEFGTDFNMESYYAELIKSKTTKIEFNKSWNHGKYIGGKSCKFNKDKIGKWKLISCKNVSEDDWP